jgi:hypothetical protein
MLLPGCKRTVWTDVEMLVGNGLGNREVKRCRPRCRKCGHLGIWSFTGPVPEFRETTQKA